MAYKVHPYQWPTIGKCVEQIEEATLQTILDFYHRFYAPNNAILSIAGNISAEQAFALSEKWFGPIPTRHVVPRALPQEEPQQHIRRKTVHRDVPTDLLVMTFHMPDRRAKDYYTCDLITDLLGNGYSSRLTRKLVHEKHLFSTIDSYIQGSMEPGLLFIIGRLAEGVSFKEGEEAVWNELRMLKEKKVNKVEFDKVCNRSESERVFNNINYLNRAMNMAMLEYVGKDKELEDELEHYRSVNTEDIQRVARQLFRKPNSCILYYARKEDK